MIPISRLVRNLEREVRRFKNQDQTYFVQGVLQGLKLSIVVARELFKETREKMICNPMGITKKRSVTNDR